MTLKLKYKIFLFFRPLQIKYSTEKNNLWSQCSDLNGIENETKLYLYLLTLTLDRNARIHVLTCNRPRRESRFAFSSLSPPSPMVSSLKQLLLRENQNEKNSSQTMETPDRQVFRASIVLSRIMGK